jgi:4-carboxymuconolactone decarboxylase
MRTRLLILFAALLPVAGLKAQAPPRSLPPDIHPVTLSRLPPVSPSDLDEEGQKLLAARGTVTPGPGPTHVTIYSPKVAEGFGTVGRALGVPRGDGFRFGVRAFQLIVLITAREIDQQYEWTAHEPAGLKAGLEQSVIDVVKYDRDVKGLAAKDALLITFGRGLFRDHKVSSDTWAQMVKEFGRQGTIEIMALMADYFTVGFMMNAADQQLPADRQPLLPALTRRR